MEKQCFLSSSTQNHAESLWNYLKKSVLDPKCVKFDQKSEFGHVQTCPDLSGPVQEDKSLSQNHVYTFFFLQSLRLLYFGVSKPWFLSSYTQNHAEPLWNYLKKSVLDPKRAKLIQNADVGHVRIYSWLHKLRNTQGKINGTYLEGIYAEYTRNIYRISIFMI